VTPFVRGWVPVLRADRPFTLVVGLQRRVDVVAERERDGRRGGGHPRQPHRLRDRDQHSDDLVDGRARGERRCGIPLERRLGCVERDQRPEPDERVGLRIQTRGIDVGELHREDVLDVSLVAERHASERVLVLGHGRRPLRGRPLIPPRTARAGIVPTG